MLPMVGFAGRSSTPCFVASLCFTWDAPYTARSSAAMDFDMVPTFTLSFLDLMESELRRASKGLTSSHYLHNIRSGIANIVDLIEYDNDIAQAAGHLTRVATNYINRHDAISAAVTEPEARADADRFRTALAALVHFRAALERARPNSRVHALGLG